MILFSYQWSFTHCNIAWKNVRKCRLENLHFDKGRLQTFPLLKGEHTSSHYRTCIGAKILQTLNYEKNVLQELDKKYARKDCDR